MKKDTSWYRSFSITVVENWNSKITLKNGMEQLSNWRSVTELCIASILTYSLAKGSHSVFYGECCLWMYVKIFDYGLWTNVEEFRPWNCHSSNLRPPIKILKPSFQIQKLIIEGKWVKVYRKGIGSVRNFQRLPKKNPCSK